MKHDEFVDLQLTSGPLPIELADGRMGLVAHWTDEEALIDAYRGNEGEGEQIRLPFNKIRHLGGGALSEITVE